jgi:hypothetical protein
LLVSEKVAIGALDGACAEWTPSINLGSDNQRDRSFHPVASSIKAIGTGRTVAALAVPLIALAFSWRSALIVSGLLCLVWLLG